MVAYLDSSVVVKTIDALHLATILALAKEENEVHVFSHDKAMNLCARALGFKTPLAEKD